MVQPSDAHLPRLIPSRPPPDSRILRDPERPISDEQRQASGLRPRSGARSDAMPGPAQSHLFTVRGPHGGRWAEPMRVSRTGSAAAARPVAKVVLLPGMGRGAHRSAPAGPPVDLGVESAPKGGAGHVHRAEYRGVQFTMVGQDLGGFETLDLFVHRHMRRYNIPNATVALSAPDGRLVYCKGFTNDTWWETDGAAFSDALQRLDKLTLFDLLTHGAGWLDGDAPGLVDDPDRTEPSYNRVDTEVAGFTGTTLPVSWQEIIRYCFSASASGSVLRQFIDHPARRPGQYSYYTNLGFMLLGRIVAHVSGSRFKSYMQEKVFGPLGMAYAGYSGSTLEERVDGEVPFFDIYPWEPEADDLVRLQVGPSVMQSRLATAAEALANPVYRGDPTLAGRPDVYDTYGTRNFGTFAPAGGMLAPALSVLRLLVALRTSNRTSILNARSRGDMLSPQAMWSNAGTEGAQQDYGLGWKLIRWGDRPYAYGHSGHMTGTESGAWLITDNPFGSANQDTGGMGVVCATNRLNRTYDPDEPDSHTVGEDLGSQLRWLAAQRYTTWLADAVAATGAGDLWEEYT